MIKGLSKLAVHYKVLAAGRTDPQAAFTYVAAHLRPQDAVCIGAYTKNHPSMLEENLAWLGWQASVTEPVW